MMLNNGEPIPDIHDRFEIAQDGPIPDDVEDRKSLQRIFRGTIYGSAQLLNKNVAQSRELSLALTHLEEALMWAGKAIFK